MLDKLKHNIKPLSASIIIAVISWFMITTEKEYIDQVTVPLEIKSLSEGKTLLAPVPKKVRLEIKGKGRALIGVSFYDVKFSLELPHIKTFKRIELKDYLNYLDLPPKLGIEVVQVIDPQVIEIKVDKKVSIKKPVRITGEVQVEPGYILMESQLSEDSVLVTGPEKLVRRIRSIETEPFHFESRKYRFDHQAKLVCPEPDVIRISLDRVDIHFDIQRLVERMIYEIPVKILNVPAGLEVTSIPPTLALRIKGGEEPAAAVTQDDIKATIDYRKSYRPDKKEYGASIEMPDKVSWIESIPKTFRLHIKRKQ